MHLYCRPGTFMSSCLMNSLPTKIKSIQQCLDLCPSIQHTPVLGQIQFCDVCLEEGSVAVVTIALPVLLHKVFHEIHSSNVFGFGQQVAGVTATETHRNTCCQLHSPLSDWLVCFPEGKYGALKASGSYPIPAPSSSTVEPDSEGSMERISGSSLCVSSWARESSIISSMVAPLECSFQNSVMFVRTEKHTGDTNLINTFGNQTSRIPRKLCVLTVDFSTDNRTNENTLLGVCDN